MTGILVLLMVACAGDIKSTSPEIGETQKPALEQGKASTEIPTEETSGLAESEALDESTAADLVSPGIVNLELVDRSNLGNAADFEVRFDILRPELLGREERVILVKAELAASFDLDAAANLPESRTVAPVVNGKAIHYRLPDRLVDSEGDAIIEGKAYVFYVHTISGSGDYLSGPSSELTLLNEPVVWTLVRDLPSATGGLAVDSEGYIYAANIGRAPSRTGSEIYRIAPDGAFDLWVEGQGLSGASGNTFDDQGNLLQSSLRASLIHIITPEGVVSEFAREGISGPVGVMVAADGTIFVANCRGNSIQKITPDGESMEFAFGPLLACPNGITIDEAGNLYVANFTNGHVVKITPDGTVNQFVEIPGHNNGHILYHRGLLYAVARGSYQIYTVTLEGEIRLLAGSGERGHKDGAALEATFSLPNDIVASPDGRRLYINEALPTEGTANQPSQIRVIELQRPD